MCEDRKFCLQDLRVSHFFVVLPEPRSIRQAAGSVRSGEETAQDLHRVDQPGGPKCLRKLLRRVQGE